MVVEEVEDDDIVGGVCDYDYLFLMFVWFFISECFERFKNQIVVKKVEYDELQVLSEKDFWVKDLDVF